MSIHGKIAEDLKGFSGHLECTVCHRSQPLGNVGGKLRAGWPKCCNLTMRWITARQEREGV